MKKIILACLVLGSLSAVAGEFIVKDTQNICNGGFISDLEEALKKNGLISSLTCKKINRKSTRINYELVDGQNYQVCGSERLKLIASSAGTVNNGRELVKVINELKIGLLPVAYAYPGSYLHAEEIKPSPRRRLVIGIPEYCP
jgi:hypothetical protein